MIQLWKFWFSSIKWVVTVIYPFFFIARSPHISSYRNTTFILAKWVHLLHPLTFIQLHGVILHGIARRCLQQRYKRMYKTSKTNMVNHHDRVFMKNNHLCKFSPSPRKILIKSVSFSHKWFFTLFRHFRNFKQGLCWTYFIASCTNAKMVLKWVVPFVISPPRLFPQYFHTVLNMSSNLCLLQWGQTVDLSPLLLGLTNGFRILTFDIHPIIIKRQKH